MSSIERDNRQRRASLWCELAFGRDHARSVPQRAVRLLEEAIELYQAAGGDEAMAHKLVTFVFARPPGELGQELGAVGLTLLLLSHAANISADGAERREFDRVMAKPLAEFRQLQRREERRRLLRHAGRADMMTITSSTFPQLHRALKEIECDNGAHLIGTVYPGEPVDLDSFTVPEAWAHLVAPAEAGLSLLKAAGDTDWVDFVLGEFTDSERIRERQGNLEEARQLLNDWFDGWPAE